MHILADAHIPWLPFLLGDPELRGKLRLSRYETPQELQELIQRAQVTIPVDALLIRTTAKINRETFPVFPPGLKCIATATAGTDHVDTGWLDAHGIQFFHSPGCNARSVGEYVITAMLNAYQGSWKRLKQKKVGIVGFGNTGQQVAELLEKLGMAFITYDPPREAFERGSGSDHASFKSAASDELLACDIITLHVPLISGGSDPTQYLLSRLGVLHDESRFELLINASRGGVLDEQQVVKLRKSGQLQHLVLDVWEDEPCPRPESMEAAELATPHIAGYSLQAKFEASRIACNQLSGALGFEINSGTPDWGISAYINAAKGVYSALHAYHPAFQLDPLLRREPTSAAFARLRNTFPLRMEFQDLWLHQLPDDPDERALARALGFGLPGRLKP
jgi:erythronate-4-phosphate dehydrogenase